MNRRRFTFALATLWAAHVPAEAQGDSAPFPNRPVRLVLPFAPGGTTDIMARLLSVKFQQETGQTLIVDNRPGAGGIIATEAVARAPADGYTLLMASSAQLAVNPYLYRELHYDPVRDFAPVALLGATPNVILVNPKQPVRSLADLIALAKAHPGEISFASPGTGSTAHLAAELLQLQAGIKMIHVPYHGGGPALSAGLGNQVQSLFVAIPSIVGPVKGGLLRPLAVTSAKRAPALPDVPTVAQTFPGFEAVGWYGVVAPAHTPPATVQRLYELFRRIADMQDVRAAWAKEGIDTLEASPAQFGSYIQAELKKWGDVIHRAKVTAE
jgi:tripartite-type tricarboxylate transporter receptor subunit TctC